MDSFEIPPEIIFKFKLTPLFENCVFLTIMISVIMCYFDLLNIHYDNKFIFFDSYIVIPYTNLKQCNLYSVGDDFNPTSHNSNNLYKIYMKLLLLINSRRVTTELTFSQLRSR